MKTFLIQGDSITDAGRDRNHDSGRGIGYANYVAGEIMYDYAGDIQVINRGISGNRVVDLYARIKSDFINLKPEYISILIGVNDVWHELARQDGVDTEKYFKVYSMLIEELQEALPGVKIMILEPFCLRGPATEEFGYEAFRSGVEEKAAKAKEVAEKYNLKFIPLQEKFDKLCEKREPGYWLMDGVHPRESGHEMIARELSKAFREIV